MKRRKRILDQLYNGAFENVNLSSNSKRAIYGAGIIVLIGVLINYSATKKNEL
jgi:hypothetical protein